MKQEISKFPSFNHSGKEHMVLFLDRGGESNERCERRYQKDSTNFTPCKF